MVCADESGQDNLSGAVNRFGIRESAFHFSRIAHCGNQFPVGDNSGIPEDAILFAKRNNDSIFKTSGHGSSPNFLSTWQVLRHCGCA